MKKEKFCEPGSLDNIWQKRQRFYFFSIVAVLFLLGGCGSSSTDDDNGGGGSSNLTVTVMDDPLTENLLADAYVSLYNADNQTILKTIKTSSDGVANFTNVSDTVTVTVAYENNGQGFSEIRTIYDFKPGNYSIFMKDVGCGAQQTINATYNSIAGSPIVASLDPHLSGDGALLLSHSTTVSSGTAVFTGVSVCLDDIQSDGKLTHFAYGLNASAEITSYGFEADQTITAGATYTSTASLTPTNLNWSAATTEDNPDAVVLQAVRKGVTYSNLGFWPRPDDDGGAADGIFPVADQFPADAFIAVATQNLDAADDGKVTVRRYDTYQQNISIDFSENEFTDFTYDATAENFSWTLTGNSDKDFLQVSTVFGSTKWSLNMSHVATSVKLPDLPSDVEAWFNRANMDADETKVMVGDVLATNGYAEYNALTASTADITTTITVDADMVIRQLGDIGNIGNGNGNGNGGNALYGTVTLTGDSTNFSASNYSPTSTTTVSGITAWTDGAVVLTMQSFAPFDASKAASLSLARSDGITTSWGATPSGLDGIPGVSVSTNSVTFTDAVVTNQVLGTSVTINGTLSY